MAFSSGAFTRTNGTNTGSTLWNADKVAGTKITSSNHDTHDQDLANGINATVMKAGTNIHATSSGTNTVVVTLTPAATAYTAGQFINFKAGGTCTGAVTVNVNALGAKAIQKLGAALVAGDITANNIVSVVYDGTQFQMVSPAKTPVLSGNLSDIAALAVTNSAMIVGDGSNYVLESGATLRTSIGVGTGDSPQVTGIELGHASDTTITRASSGNLNIEGNIIYRAGGTDVAISDGGTGAGTAAAAASALGVGTEDSPQFTGIELGHATDTTIARASSGDLNIEGNIIYRAGGTDVVVADGGTGVSTLADGGILLGSGTGAITALAALAKGSVVVGDGATDPVALAVGSNTHVLTADSGEASGLKWAAVSAGFTLSSEVATTSGTTADFTSLSADVRVIKIVFEEVSFSGSVDNLQIQIGDSGGIETSNYHSMSAAGDNTGFSGTAGFAISIASEAADTHSGIITLAMKDATNHTWCLAGIIADNNQTADTFMSGGSKTLSAALDRVRFTTENGRTLDGGSIAILTL